MRLAVLVLALLAAGPATGQVRPQPGAGDPRLQTVEFRPDQVVQLQAAPGYQLSVEFAPDERIENVALGDSGAWQVTANRRGDRLFVKPIQAGISTNMTVVTDVRTYAFDLAPLSGPASDMAYTVRFNYPKPATTEPDLPVAPVAGRYRLRGTKSLRPSAISDDGVHTYIEWPASVALPAVYALDGRGRQMLVNGMMRDGTFVIDSIASHLVFRIDGKTAHALRQVERRQ